MQGQPKMITSMHPHYPQLKFKGDTVMHANQTINMKFGQANHHTIFRHLIASHHPVCKVFVWSSPSLTTIVSFHCSAQCKIGPGLIFHFFILSDQKICTANTKITQMHQCCNSHCVNGNTERNRIDNNVLQQL